MRKNIEKTLNLQFKTANIYIFITYVIENDQLKGLICVACHSGITFCLIFKEFTHKKMIFVRLYMPTPEKMNVLPQLHFATRKK